MSEKNNYLLEMASRLRPRPLSSLTASAVKLTDKTIVGRGAGGTTHAWQEEAWDMYDLVGEQRFLASTLSGRLAQARLYVGIVPDNETDDIPPAEPGLASEVFEAFGGSPTARGQILSRLATNLFVAGDGWLVGIPTHLLHGGDGEDENDRLRTISPIDREQVTEPGLDINDLHWRMLSVSEVSFDRDNNIILDIDGNAEHKITCRLDQVYPIRVWRAHPRRWWEADSPTRASLPVLRELVGLTMHISAQIDSRLAGAGVFIVPKSAKDSLISQYGENEDDEDSDPFTEALIEAMITPIEDRSSAAGIVPLVLTVPDGVADSFRHIKFSNDLDSEAKNMRDEAIRRLALGQDAPPEILLGVGGMNHWGAWLVREDTITTHIEPPLALICDALTTQYLWPILLQQGMAREEVEKHVIWYDVSHMVSRPNRASDAFKMRELNAISDEALRDATGFDEGDAPVADETDRAILLALDLAKSAPSLAQNPGLDVLTQQIRELLEGTPPEVDPTEDEATADDDTGDDAPTVDGDIPETDEDDAEPTDAGDGLTAGGGFKRVVVDTVLTIDPAHVEDSTDEDADDDLEN